MYEQIKQGYKQNKQDKKYMCEAHYGESLLWFHKSNVFVKPICHTCINDICSLTIYEHLLWENPMEATELDKRVSYRRMFITLVCKFTCEKK